MVPIAEKHHLSPSRPPKKHDDIDEEIMLWTQLRNAFPTIWALRELNPELFNDSSV